MATAVRLSPDTESPYRRGATVAVGVGEFGARVVALLAAGSPAVVPADDVDSAFRADPGLVVLASWRPVPVLCERVDRWAYETGTPWLPVVLEHPVIRVGPWIAPPTAPCHACYRGRRAQHDEYGSKTDVLHAAYDRDVSLGPSGYLPHHARAAAAAAQLVLGRPAPALAETAGRLLTLRPDTLQISYDRVLARHGCLRCGDQPVRRDLRVLLGHDPAAGTR